jgi:2,3-bisphosphoglycerate-dependent phosphoglycerate mutase
MSALLKLAMTIFVLWLASPCSVSGEENAVFFVVRHAEKASSGSDPALSPIGQKRAESLKQMLQQLRVDSIFSTDFVRTKATVQPLSVDNNIAIELYRDPTQEWIDSVIKKGKGKRTLIVGHSNTVPSIVSRLTGNQIPTIGERYDDLFIVVISENNRSFVSLKYGESH